MAHGFERERERIDGALGQGAPSEPPTRTRASPQPEPERAPNPSEPPTRATHHPHPSTHRTHASEPPTRATHRPHPSTHRTQASAHSSPASAHSSQEEAEGAEGGQTPHRPRGQGAGQGSLGPLRTHRIPPPYRLKRTWLQRSISAFTTFFCHGSIGAVTGLAPGRMGPGRLGKQCGVAGVLWSSVLSVLAVKSPIAAPTPPARCNPRCNPHPAPSSPSAGFAPGCSLLGGGNG